MMDTKPLVYAFDLDNTLCVTEGNDYENAKPIKERIRCVNRLHHTGHTIYIYTGRGTSSGIDWKKLTMSQIRKWKISCDKVIFGKPPYDIFIDDKAINARQFQWT